MKNLKRRMSFVYYYSFLLLWNPRSETEKYSWSHCTEDLKMIVLNSKYIFSRNSTRSKILLLTVRWTTINWSIPVFLRYVESAHYLQTPRRIPGVETGYTRKSTKSKEIPPGCNIQSVPYQIRLSPIFNAKINP